MGAPFSRKKQAHLALNSPQMLAALALCNKPWVELTVWEAQVILFQVKILIEHRVRFRPPPVRAPRPMGPSHTCIACGRTFNTPYKLDDHMNEHSGAKPYQCDEPGCRESFFNRRALGRHKKHIHNKTFMCLEPGCGKVFSVKSILMQHSETHSDARPWACREPGCGKRFKTEDVLKGHRRVHTKEKKFACDFQGCGKRFGYKVDLTRHMRTHYGQPAKLTNNKPATPAPAPLADNAGVQGVGVGFGGIAFGGVHYGHAVTGYEHLSLNMAPGFKHSLFPQ